MLGVGNFSHSRAALTSHTAHWALFGAAQSLHPTGEVTRTTNQSFLPPLWGGRGEVPNQKNRLLKKAIFCFKAVFPAFEVG